MVNRASERKVLTSSGYSRTAEHEAGSLAVGESRLEELRLTITMTIAATMVSLYALPESVKWAYTIRPVTVIPGLLSLLYIILLASHLKYKNKSMIGDLAIPRSFQAGVYDFAIDNFWASFFIGAIFVGAKVLGWDGEPNSFGVMKGAIIACPALLLLAIWMSHRRQKEEGREKTDKN